MKSSIAPRNSIGCQKRLVSRSVETTEPKMNSTGKNDKHYIIEDIL